MKLNFWKLFLKTWDALIGKAVELVTLADGKNGLSWDDIRITADLIKEAELKFGTGEERRVWVLEQMKNLKEFVLPHIAELAFWTALNYAQTRGWINLGNGKIKVD